MKVGTIENEYLDELINESNNRAHTERRERLRILVENQTRDSFPATGLAVEYYEEARLCWYMGAFVSTILIVQLAFDEQIRSRYRYFSSPETIKMNRKLADEISFARLITIAREDKLLSRKEAGLLDWLRKSLRNAYTHPKSIGDPNRLFDEKSHVALAYKMTRHDVLDDNVITDARKAILLLLTLFPDLCRRSLQFGREISDLIEGKKSE